MTLADRPRQRRPLWPLAVLAVAVAAVCALALWHPWRAAPAPPRAAASGASAVVEPVALHLPTDPTVLVFGDSWTYGSAATDPTLGYAYLLGPKLGGASIVDGVRGSGYLKQGLDGGTFGERIAQLDPALEPDLVIVEGSINDRRSGAAGYRPAVTAAWDALAALYPDAAIVILGPAPQVLPIEAATARIDEDLADLAAQRGWWYISPLQDGWIDDANYTSVIDTSAIGNNHPSTAGHAYLADRVAEALAALSRPQDVAADAPVEPDALIP